MSYKFSRGTLKSRRNRAFRMARIKGASSPMGVLDKRVHIGYLVIYSSILFIFSKKIFNRRSDVPSSCPHGEREVLACRFLIKKWLDPSPYDCASGYSVKSSRCENHFMFYLPTWEVNFLPELGISLVRIPSWKASLRYFVQSFGLSL